MFVSTFACASYIHYFACTYVHMYIPKCIYLCFVLQFLAVAPILNVDIMPDEPSTTVTLECTLPCFSPDIRCGLCGLTLKDGDVVITRDGEIMGSTMSYSYPTQQIMISNLASDRIYDFCVVTINTTNNTDIGDPVYGSFTTTGIAIISLLLYAYVSRVHSTHHTRLSNSQYTLYNHVTVMYIRLKQKQLHLHLIFNLTVL